MDLQKLKVAEIKSIEVMLEKLGGRDKMITTEILSKARLALEKELVLSLKKYQEVLFTSKKLHQVVVICMAYARSA